MLGGGQGACWWENCYEILCEFQVPLWVQVPQWGYPSGRVSGLSSSLNPEPAQGGQDLGVCSAGALILTPGPHSWLPQGPSHSLFSAETLPHIVQVPKWGRAMPCSVAPSSGPLRKG